MNFPIGLQLYSVREDLEKDFEGTLRKVKALKRRRQLSLPVCSATARKKFEPMQRDRPHSPVCPFLWI